MECMGKREMIMVTGGGELIRLSQQKPDDSTILFKCLGQLTNSLSLMTTLTSCRPAHLFCLSVCNEQLSPNKVQMMLSGDKHTK